LTGTTGGRQDSGTPNKFKVNFDYLFLIRLYNKVLHVIELSIPILLVNECVKKELKGPKKVFHPILTFFIR
tara:strand:+ start:930 stop:1142 length:213 start_codon:yes stop_codon:yes gene_type:complete